VVVFPAPFTPSKAKHSPSLIVNETSLTATFSSPHKALKTFLILSTLIVTSVGFTSFAFFLASIISSSSHNSSV